MKEDSHEDHYDPETGDIFTADYTPPGQPTIKGVRVQVLEFDDDHGGYAWEIIGPVENGTRGYRFDDFEDIRDFDQGSMRD